MRKLNVAVKLQDIRFSADKIEEIGMFQNQFGILVLRSRRGVQYER
jgi:hypothetical protein